MVIEVRGAVTGDRYKKVGLTHTACIEGGGGDRVRLVVSFREDDAQVVSHSQGIDLSPQECRALADLMLSAASTAEKHSMH